MLGSSVARWLRARDFDVRTTDVRYGDGTSTHDALIDEVCASGCSAVVNCIGTTPRRVSGPGALFAINSVLPQRLAAALGDGRLLVHASSDAVFDGQRGDYRVEEPPNALDAYGLSKRLGELAVHLGRVVVIRCSIVGLEQDRPHSLLGWFLAQTAPVNGYTNQYWNGITTLEWSRIAGRALSDESTLACGIHQPACARPVSKHELLESAGRAFGKAPGLVAAQSDQPVNRTLVPTIACPPIEQQLEELRLWHEGRLAS